MISGCLADRDAVRRAAVSIAALLAACAFDGLADSGPNLEAGQSSSTGAEGSSGSSGGRGTTDAQTGSAGSSTSTPPAEDDSGLPETTASATTSSEDTGEATTGGSDETTGPDVDCTIPVTMSRSAADGELFPPMMLGEYQGATYAFSEQADAGAIRFTYTLACPSNYRLYARVRDDDPGTSNCCDPDSFDVEGPDGLDVSWFYGCDTESVGWNWVQLESGVLGGTCNEPTPLVLRLSPGEHAFTVRNRESNYFEARAGIAELILTNDPTFSP